MKKLFTLAIFFAKNDKEGIETVKSTVCISVFLIVLLSTLFSCSSNSQDFSCPKVVEKRVDKNYSPSKLYIVLNNGQTYSVSYTKYISINVGDEACTAINFN